MTVDEMTRGQLKECTVYNVQFTVKRLKKINSKLKDRGRGNPAFLSVMGL